MPADSQVTDNCSFALFATFCQLLGFEQKVAKHAKKGLVHVDNVSCARLPFEPRVALVPCDPGLACVNRFAVKDALCGMVGGEMG